LAAFLLFPFRKVFTPQQGWGKDSSSPKWITRRGDGARTMTTFDLFVVFGPVCAFAIAMAAAFEIVRIKGGR
jgi:hypothetical protein